VIRRQICRGRGQLLLAVVSPRGRRFHRRGISVLVGLSVVSALIAVSAPAAHADSTVTSFSFVSAPGDFVGAGQTVSYTGADGQLGGGGTAGRVIFSAIVGGVQWVVNLAAPLGSQLVPGTYDNAVRVVNQTGTQPGIDVYGDGRGCNNDFGSFAIRAISADSHGVVDVLDATFTQHCESLDAPPLSGVVKFNAPASAPIVLTSSNPSVLLDQPTTLTADVAGATAGSVEFFDGATSIGTAAVDATGLAQLTTSALPAGIHSLTAVYAGSTSLPIFQTVRDNAVSFRFSSGWGFNTLDAGATASFAAPDDAVTVRGSPSFVVFNASSGNEDWTVNITAPTGQTLQVGNYPTLATNTTSGPGVGVEGDSQGCSTSSGSLDISAIRFDPVGDVTALGATFVIHCSGAPTIPFVGTIQYDVRVSPTAPQSPSAVALDSGAILLWHPPTYSGNPSFTQYVITAYIGYFPAKVQTVASTATIAVMTGLVNGRTYVFKIAAKNTAIGPESRVTNPVRIGAPAAPTSAHATAGIRIATLRWTAPPNNGSPINGYTIWPYIDGVLKPSRTFASPATVETFTGLATGQTYTFKIAARNARGAGPQSAATNAVTPT